MKFEKTRVMNFENALRGMRNPKNSWGLSDSYFGFSSDKSAYWNLVRIADKWLNSLGISLDETNRREDYKKYQPKIIEILREEGNLTPIPLAKGVCEVAYIGPSDMRLISTLAGAGSPEHRKFLRQIFISVDITAPMYWWSEFDTYKVGTVSNSTSKMHKLASTPITLECFEHDDLTEGIINYEAEIQKLEELRLKYIETKDKKYWKELIRWLPESWLQTRTITMTYENVLNMISQRKNHKLNEWSGIDCAENENFIKWALSLPYMIYFYDFSKKNTNAFIDALLS